MSFNASIDLQVAFGKYDRTQGGKTSSYNLRPILWESGLTVSNKVLECLVLRFAKNRILTAEAFVMALVRLHLAHGITLSYVCYHNQIDKYTWLNSPNGSKMWPKSRAVFYKQSSCTIIQFFSNLSYKSADRNIRRLLGTLWQFSLMLTDLFFANIFVIHCDSFPAWLHVEIPLHYLSNYIQLMAFTALAFSYVGSKILEDASWILSRPFEVVSEPKRKKKEISWTFMVLWNSLKIL